MVNFAFSEENILEPALSKQMTAECDVVVTSLVSKASLKRTYFYILNGHFHSMSSKYTIQINDTMNDRFS